MNQTIDGQRVKINATDDAPGAAVYTPGTCTPVTYTPVTYTPIVARVPITIRPAVMGDVAFIDRLQKADSKALGFLPFMAIEGKIRLGQVLLAEATGLGAWGLGPGENALRSESGPSPRPQAPSPIGYLIAADRYQKRDEIGYVTQINVVPEYRRSLVAAQLLQAQFDRSAYGCRLYCCWCAQDLKANEFWAAMGFTAIAFRTGSMKRGKNRVEGRGLRGEKKNADASALLSPLPSSLSPRVHIFWQKKIRANDSTAHWWYPSQTGGGELREDRLVFPIMPGVHWRDVGPIVLEPMQTASVVGRGEIPPRSDDAAARTAGLALPDAAAVRAPDVCAPDVCAPNAEATPPRKSKRAKTAAAVIAKPLVSPRARGGFWTAEEGVPDTLKTKKQLAEEAKALRAATAAATTAATRKKNAPRPTAAKAGAKPIDPRLTALSRTLRDQWAERAETNVSPAIGKHDVKRIADAPALATLAPPSEPAHLEKAPLGRAA